MEERQEQLLAQARYIEQQSKEAQAHLDTLTTELDELERFKEYLETLKRSAGREALASLGKGIHVTTNIASNDLYVEIGAGIIVKKSPEETKKVIEKQIGKLHEAKEVMIGRIAEQMQMLHALSHELGIEHSH